jgi:predicted metal-dependent phosphoesterase TrpH
MDYLSGVEISVTFADTTVHIVGLGFDPADEQLVQGLADTRDGRAPARATWRRSWRRPALPAPTRARSGTWATRR